MLMRNAASVPIRKATAHQHMMSAVRHHEIGELAAAEKIYRQVLSMQPRNYDALHLLGVVAHQSGKHAESVQLIERAIALHPTEPSFYVNAGLAYAAMGDLEKAMSLCEKAIALQPNLPEVHNNLGQIYKGLGMLDAAVASFRKAMSLRPGYMMAHSNLLFTLNYLPGLDPKELFAEHVRWAREYAEPLRKEIRPYGNSKDLYRPLRVGYVSPDFKQHAVAYFIEPILAHHDRERFYVTCYSDVKIADEVTSRLKQRVARWREIANMPDEQVAEMIRRDEIDILIDLAGHTAGSRMLVFARKPAPVQITYLGYPATTGMDAMDYRITDFVADPPGKTESLHTEALLRAGQSAWCYRPDATAGAVAPAPVARNGYITFGSFNNFVKVTPEVLTVWAQVLAAVPDSRLLLKARGLHQPGIQSRLREHFERHQIDPRRLEFHAGNSSFAEHLAMYARVDVALDTFPYNGTTTSCEAMYMGVPVVTLAGEVHAARVGASLLNAMKMAELVASNAEQYVKIARELANDLPRLQSMRAGMRERMERSPLRDEREFTMALESAYRRAWEAWCAGDLEQINSGITDANATFVAGESWPPGNYQAIG